MQNRRTRAGVGVTNRFTAAVLSDAAGAPTQPPEPMIARPKQMMLPVRAELDIAAQVEGAHRGRACIARCRAAARSVQNARMPPSCAALKAVTSRASAPLPRAYERAQPTTTAARLNLDPALAASTAAAAPRLERHAAESRTARLSEYAAAAAAGGAVVMDAESVRAVRVGCTSLCACTRLSMLCAGTGCAASRWLHSQGRADLFPHGCRPHGLLVGGSSAGGPVHAAHCPE